MMNTISVRVCYGVLLVFLGAAGTLCLATSARADMIALVCDRIDVTNPIHYYFRIDTTASTVSDDNGDLDKRRAYPARITDTTIDWVEIGGWRFHVDRLSGHMVMASDQGSVDYACTRGRGF
ncbi:MAG: hypothetical protein GC190_11915 [Alphaproteobacteria bacterium]|nr:hypothetical protein [Alphaproteobacteria bacterium]